MQFLQGVLLSTLLGCGAASSQNAAGPAARDEAAQVTPESGAASVVPATRAAEVDQEDWPQFRGRGGRGLSDAERVPARWSENENLLWKTELPGAGTSSPVLFGEHIYLTAHSGYGTDRNEPGSRENLQKWLLCFDRAGGSLLWKREIAVGGPESEYGGRMHWHGYASSTPAADASGVYAFFGRSGVVAFDHQGNPRWHASVGENTHDWGSAASPILYNDLVILNAFVERGELVALDKLTGEEVWSAGGLKESWNTPVLVELSDGSTELVVGIMGKVLGFDPASGERLWQCDGINWYVVGSLVADRGIVYCIAGSQYETVAIRAGGRGDVTASHLLWRANKGSNVSSAIYHEGHLYFAHEQQAIAYCLEGETGEVVYEERIPHRGRQIYASPVIADGKLFYVRRGGNTVVLAAKPGFEVLAHNAIESDVGFFNASPAIEDGRLYLRSDHYLYCIGSP
jgi:outer membrane protein assembly factor BamB